MFKKLKDLHKSQNDGFTIIEVLIVLAIAGLIMVVVFLAVPNLQRSQRNNARKSDGNNMLQNLSEYIGNVGGNNPNACNSLSACTWISYEPSQLKTVSYYKTFATAPTTAPSESTAYLISKADCNGVVPKNSTSDRDYVIWYGIEGSTKTVCTKGS